MSRLERSIRRLKEDPSTRGALLRSLHESKVILPLSDASMADARTALLQFVVIMREGRPFIPAFTDNKRFRANFAEGQPAVRFTGAELSNIWNATDWMVLNPGDETATIVAPSEVQKLIGNDDHSASGVVQLAFESLRRATHDDIAGLVKIREDAAAISNLQELWCLRSEPEENTYQWVLVIQSTDDGADDEVASRLLRTVTEAQLADSPIVTVKSQIPPDLFDELAVRLI